MAGLGHDSFESSPGDCSVQPGLRAVALSSANTFKGRNGRKTCRETLDTKSSAGIMQAGRPGREGDIQAVSLVPGPTLEAWMVCYVESFTFPLPDLKCIMRNKTGK